MLYDFTSLNIWTNWLCWSLITFSSLLPRKRSFAKLLFRLRFSEQLSLIKRDYQDVDDGRINILWHLGTVFLWMYWPSFNAALVAPDYVAQHRSVINTYFSLAAACVTTFALSPLFQREGTKWRLSMVRDNDFFNLKSLHSFNTTSCARKWENCDEHQIVKVKCLEIISCL